MTRTGLTGTDVVVGVDGRAAGRRALRWAAAEAARRGTGLKVLSAYAVTWPPEAFGGITQLPHFAHQECETLVAEAVAEARALAPGIEVTGAAALGDPAAHLIALSHGAAMVVVGKRGRGEFAGLLLGSVSQRVATHAAGTLVVVRGRSDTMDDPVVVGVDGSPSSRQVLEVAFEEADRRGCALIAVRGGDGPVPARGDRTPPDDETTARTDLEGALVPWREKYPAVSVKALVVPQSPAKALVRISALAGLLVVGSRGHRPLAGALSGSTGRHLLYHADCPVMVVRS
jgi:nucleotide-binding universal stress UspA family protein